MEEYVYIDGKKYRRGYTTGSCAAAASKAATYMLITQKKIESVNIDTPKGIYLTLKPGNIEINKEYAICSIQKMVEMISMQLILWIFLQRQK